MGFHEPIYYEKCVAVLNSIIRETNCEIVVSSDWRTTLRLPQMIEVFEMNGVIKTPIGYTPNSKLYRGDNLDVGRASEIMMWVELHGVENWVAVDDLDLEKSGYDALLDVTHFVKTPKVTEGIKQSGIKEKIIAAFDRKYVPKFTDSTIIGGWGEPLNL